MPLPPFQPLSLLSPQHHVGETYYWGEWLLIPFFRLLPADQGHLVPWGMSNLRTQDISNFSSNCNNSRQEQQRRSSSSFVLSRRPPALPGLWHLFPLRLLRIKLFAAGKESISEHTLGKQFSAVVSLNQPRILHLGLKQKYVYIT